MNVLFLTHLYLPAVGGVQRSVHNLAGLMIERGHGVSIACHGDRADVSRTGPDVLPLRIPSPFVFAPLDALRCRLRDPGNVRRLVRWCAEREVDVIHANLINVDTRYAFEVSKRLDIGVVVTLRGGETEHWLETHPRRREYVCEMLERADHVTGVASALLRQASALVPSVEAKATTVRNPVVRRRFSRFSTPRQTQEEVPFALFVGRLEAMKDVATLVRSFHRATEADPGFTLELRIVGSGSLEADLRAAAASGPAADRIRFLGSREYEETLELIRDARVLVLPSVMSEGCPNVMLEAAALGTPVIASDLGAIAELAEGGRCARVFARGDEGELAALLAEAARPGPYQTAEVAAASERLDAEHDPAKIAAAYEDIYERVVSSRSNRSS